MNLTWTGLWTLARIDGARFLQQFPLLMTSEACDSEHWTTNCMECDDCRRHRSVVERKLVKKRVLFDSTSYEVDYLGRSQSQPASVRTAMEPTNVARAINRNLRSSNWFSPTGSCYVCIVNMDATIPGHRSDLRTAARMLLARAQDTPALGFQCATKCYIGVTNDCHNCFAAHTQRRKFTKILGGVVLAMGMQFDRVLECKRRDSGRFWGSGYRL